MHGGARFQIEFIMHLWDFIWHTAAAFRDLQKVKFYSMAHCLTLELGSTVESELSELSDLAQLSAPNASCSSMEQNSTV